MKDGKVKVVSMEDMERVASENLSFGEVQNELGEKLTTLLKRLSVLEECDSTGQRENNSIYFHNVEVNYLKDMAKDVISLMDRAQAMMVSND